MLFGPLFVTELFILAIRRAHLPPHFSRAQVDVTCAILALMILFGWPIAIIVLITAMVTTSRRG
jgi:hypothetical protein